MIPKLHNSKIPLKLVLSMLVWSQHREENIFNLCWNQFSAILNKQQRISLKSDTKIFFFTFYFMFMDEIENKCNLINWNNENTLQKCVSKQVIINSEATLIKQNNSILVKQF